ncbi:MAG TPA: hydroxysqualene dehydroxylase HpnE, partial [Solirubrobacterales bacterium]|nr:hydroxysqualene dehydroxylase HpnE [Solirubrobacterales bacterium]
MRGRVVIVGGGLAGIAAAMDCAGRGAEVTLIEARGRLGGAAYSFSRDGILADNGQHVFLRCCTEYLGLLERIGARRMVTLQRRLRIPVLTPGGRTAWLRRSSLPAPLHLAGSLARYRPLGPRDRASVARAMMALRHVDRDDPAVDGQAFGDWLSAHGQSPAAVEAIWDLIVRPTLNLAPAEASLAQAAQVFQEGMLEAAAAADIGYARSPLSEIHDTVARAALERAGVEVRLRRGVTGIERRGEGFRIEAGHDPILEADAVVLAVPHERAARLLPAAAGIDANRLSRLGSSAIVNLHVLYDRRVLEHDFVAGVGTPVQFVFDRTGPSGVGRGQYLAVSLSAAGEEFGMTVADLRARYLPALAELLPAARGAQVEKFFVTREHAATFRAAPGARALRPGPRTELPGLVLAGAWTDTGWP